MFELSRWSYYWVGLY